ADPRVRVLAERAGPAQGRGPPARAHDPALAAPLALPGIAPDAHHRLAAAGGTSAPARPDGARDPARERLPPRVARRRSRDLGQSRHDASRAAVRRPQASPRAPSRDHARYRTARAARGRFLARELPPLESDGRSPLDA